MRVLQLTAGTGSFHCGTCLRDAALVQALRGLGHDAMLAPLYLPLVLEEGVDSRPVHMGGINAWLAHALPVRLPRFVQNWLDSPRALSWAAKRGEMTQAHALGEMAVSMLDGAEGEQVREIQKLLAWLETTPKPQVVLLSNALLMGLAGPLRRELGIPVLCTLQGEAPFLDALSEPQRTRAWELAGLRARDVDGFLAVSAFTGDLMAERLGLERSRVAVVPNGIEVGRYVAPASRPGPPTLGYLARMCHDKGLGTLVEAFLLLKRRPEHSALRLLAGGATLASDRPFLDGLRRRLRAAGLEGDAEFRSNLSFEEKLELLRACTLFSVPATYGESFGLYLLEAWAMGLPVVQPTHGAFPELLEATQGGLLCPPDDPAALADRLHELLANPQRARALGEKGRQAVLERYHTGRMARDVEREMERVCRMAASGASADA